RAEVALHERPEPAVGVAALAAEVREVELVVLDPADREREVHLQRTQLGVDLVGAPEIDAVEGAEDLVSLRDVTLVQAVVRLDGRPRDALELQEPRVERAGGEILDGRHRRSSISGRGPAGAYPWGTHSTTEGDTRWRTPSPISPMRPPRSSRTSMRARWRSTTTSTTPRTSRTSTPRSRARSGWTARSRRVSRTSRSSPRTSARPSATTAAGMRTTRSSGRSWGRTAAASRRATSPRRSRTRSARWTT